LNNRAQVSIEFIIIIVISLIYINTVTNPLLITTSTAAAQDVKKVGDAKIAAQTLANAVNSAVANSGESRKTVQLFLPAETGLSCDMANQEIDYSATIANLYCRQPAVTCAYSGAGACTTGVGSFQCVGSVKLIASSGGLTCPAAMASPAEIEGPFYKDFTVTKNNAGAIAVELPGAT